MLVFLWLGVVLRDPRPVAVIAPLALYALFINAFFAPKTPALQSAKEFSATKTIEGEELALGIRLANIGKDDLLVEVLDGAPTNVPIAEGSNHALLWVPAGGSSTMRYLLTCADKGRYILEPAKVRIRDPFDFYYFETEVGASELLSVVPVVEAMRGFALEPTSRHISLGASRARVAGTGSEFYSLRDYVPGDEFRRINWKATARMSQLYSNEYELEHAINAYLLLDATTVPAEVFGISVRAVASIATALLKGRNRVGLLVYSDTLRQVYPESGRKQMLQIIDALMDAEIKEPYVFETQILATKRALAPGSYVLMISPLNHPGIMRLVRVVAESDCVVSLIIPYDIGAEESGVFEKDVYGVASELLALRRENVSLELRNYGINIIRWNPREGLHGLLEVLRKRPSRT